MPRVIATKPGFYDLNYRDVGEEFEVDESVFAKRPIKDKDGKPTGESYPDPSWFKVVSPKAKAEVADSLKPKPGAEVPGQGPKKGSKVKDAPDTPGQGPKEGKKDEAQQDLV